MIRNAMTRLDGAMEPLLGVIAGVLLF